MSATDKIRQFLYRYGYYFASILTTGYWCFYQNFTTGSKMQMDSMNVEVFLFNYSYGMIPRALMGQIYSFFVKKPTFDTIVEFSIAEHLILSCVILSCVFIIYKKLEKADRNLSVAFFILLTVIGSFTNSANFGRSDEMLVALSFIAAIILITDKGIWLLPMIAILGELTHEGYTFLYANVILAGLLYKYFRTYKKKYAICFGFSFVAVCILFLYFAFVGNHNETAYHAISAQAMEMMHNSYYDNFLQAEFLGVNLFKEELVARPRAIIEFCLYLIFMFPIAKKVFIYLKRLFSAGLPEYWVFAAGILTLLPEYLLKLDFGRWTLALFLYIVLMSGIALANHDHYVRGLYHSIFLTWEKREATWTKVGYLFTNPFYAQAMCGITFEIYKILHGF